jgi:signal transduction histidine kinase
MHEHLHQMLAPAGIEYLFSHGGVTSEKKLRTEFRQNVYRVFKETINNTVKHSGASLVNVDVLQEGGLFRLTIRDNGYGMTEGKKGGGQGLSNMRMRAGRLGGALEFVSGNEGVVITLTAPI